MRRTNTARKPSSSAVKPENNSLATEQRISASAIASLYPCGVSVSFLMRWSSERRLRTNSPCPSTLPTKREIALEVIPVVSASSATVERRLVASTYMMPACAALIPSALVTRWLERRVTSESTGGRKKKKLSTIAVTTPAPQPTDSAVTRSAFANALSCNCAAAQSTKARRLLTLCRLLG